MNKTLFCLFLLVLAGCGKEVKNSPSVYFAGEIVNPTSEYVVLYKDDVEIDSARLDEENRFAFRLDSLAPGLHHFSHAPEYQYVYLQQGDSLVVRLNTSDFDESLVYSGEGEELNNFMIEMFLAHEEEEAFISSLYEMEPGAFSQNIDSLRTQKLELLSELTGQIDFSAQAQDMARASIDYNYYIYKELYPFYHKRKTGSESIPQLDDNFYGYRKQLDLNNANLTYFRPYYKYINYHLGNLTYMQCWKNCDFDDHTMNSYLHFNRHKLGLIDSLINEPDLRDNVFRHVAIDYLLKVQDNEENNRQFIEAFHKLSANNRHINEINSLYEGIRNIQPNKAIPDIQLINFEEESISLRDITRDKKVVLYFWTGTQKNHFDNITQRIAELSEAKPEYNFVGINFNTEPGRWRALVDGKGLDKQLQYRSDNFKELTNTLIVYPLNKAIIANDSLIVDGFANLYNTSF